MKERESEREREKSESREERGESLREKGKESPPGSRGLVSATTCFGGQLCIRLRPPIRIGLVSAKTYIAVYIWQCIYNNTFRRDVEPEYTAIYTLLYIHCYII